MALKHPGIKTYLQSLKQDGYKVKNTLANQGEYGYDVTYKGKKFNIDLFNLRGFWYLMVTGPDGKALKNRYVVPGKRVGFMAGINQIASYVGNK